MEEPNVKNAFQQSEEVRGKSSHEQQQYAAPYLQFACQSVTNFLTPGDHTQLWVVIIKKSMILKLQLVGLKMTKRRAKHVHTCKKITIF